jgi:hypothetical protein
MLNYQNTVNFEKGEDSGITLRNFSAPEDGFVWSHGKWCEIVFSFKHNSRLVDGMVELILDIEAFHVPESFPEQSVCVYFNGLRVASSHVSRRMILSAPFERRLLKGTENIVTIDTPDVVSPTAYGVNDTRLLGIKLFSLQIRDSSFARHAHSSHSDVTKPGGASSRLPALALRRARSG